MLDALLEPIVIVDELDEFVSGTRGRLGDRATGGRGSTTSDSDSSESGITIGSPASVPGEYRSLSGKSCRLDVDIFVILQRREYLIEY
jgi:hypothetical protein